MPNMLRFLAADLGHGCVHLLGYGDDERSIPAADEELLLFAATIGLRKR